MSQQVAIGPKDYDYEENYSYTTPREEFDRDSAAKPAAGLRPRRQSYDRRDRPRSIVGLEGYVAPCSTRDPGPPIASRGLDRIKYDRPPRADDDMDIGRRYSVRDLPTRDKDELYDPPKRRMSQKAPVSSNQDRDRDESYTSYREDYDEKRDRRRRPRYEEPKDSGKFNGDPPRKEYSAPRRRYRNRRDEEGSGPGLGTATDLAEACLAAAGIASARSKYHDRDSEEEEAARRKRKVRDKERNRRARDIDPRDDDRGDDRTPWDRRLDMLVEDESNPRERRDRIGEDHDSSDRSNRDRHKHRCHRRDRGDEKDKEDDDLLSISSDSRQTDSPTRDPEKDDRNRRYEEKRRRRWKREDRGPHGFIANDETPIVQEQRYKESLKPQRPRQVELTFPALKEPEAFIRGILKQPKEKFPEYPNVIREGVAPLKDVGKKGVPPGARWTKIDRRLVNPAALEDAHERFEERVDYVIVLRVLTKEEVQGFAVKTQEIRGK
jgi:hypothetical protein